MTSEPGTDLGPFAPLAERLQDITEALAATTTQQEVITVVLTPAVQALGATAGIVLLVHETDQQLKIGGSQGYEDGALTLWQEGAVEDHVLIADILRMREAQYFEHAEALKEAYPELESRAGALAPVANATLPMFLDHRPLGVIVLDFKEPHHFTPAERRFLRILSAQCAVALGRAQATVTLEDRVAERTRQLEEERAAQEAFVTFTETIGSETDLPALVRQAITVLCARFPEASVGYYEEEDTVWKARAWSEDVAPGTAAVIAAGLPADLPMFAQVLQSRELVFADSWNNQPVKEEGDEEEYGAVATYPLMVNGELRWLLSVARRGSRTWSKADRSLVRAVGRALNLALERTETARQVTLQNAELQARTRSLEAFAELTRDLALTTDPLLLIRRAQEVVLPMLSDGAALYYVPEGDRWACQVQHGTLHSPELQAAVDAGLPYAESPNLLIPWTTGQPYFLDVYDRASAQLPPLLGHISASVTLPLQVEGQLIGLLVFVLYHQRTWTSVDRVVLETTVHSLELALDRAAKTRRLEEERAALEAFTRFTEEVGSDTDVQALVRRAIALLEETRSVDVTYFERHGELLRLLSWNPALPAELLVRLQVGFPLTQPGFARALQERQAVFEDHWDAVGRGIPEGAMHGVLAIQPFFEDGEMTSVLVMGSRTSDTWSERDRGIFRAMGRSLELALDRAAKTRKLEEERTALQAFTRFAELVGSETEVQILVQRAITLLYDTCGVEGVYFERDGALFKAAVWCAQFDQSLLPRLQQGFPLQDSGLAQGLLRNTATFIDHWNDTGLLIEATGVYQAVAGYPYLVDGVLQSVLLIGSKTTPTWDERTRGIFRAVGRSLDLVLDRVRQTTTVTAQRDTLEAQTRELAARTGQLEDSTKELEAFSYSVSHDLRAPVRHMIGFLKLAQKSLDGRLDERSRRYLDMVEQAGTQMNTLIDGLLNLSRAAQQTLQTRKVDLNELMTQIQTTLLPDLLSRNVQWEVALLPAVQGDPDALKQVLVQLTENALKFTRTRDPAIIKVWAEDQGDTWGVFVQDNGLGFDPRYQERLFNLFQRLHSAQQASGTGIGLASVRRLILKHGGQVFAEGQVDQGATFGFTLPKNRPAVILLLEPAQGKEHDPDRARAGELEPPAPGGP